MWYAYSKARNGVTAPGMLCQRYLTESSNSLNFRKSRRLPSRKASVRIRQRPTFAPCGRSIASTPNESGCCSGGYSKVPIR
jgi:hypothetical protein